jgi:ankyrin repeat protein
MHFCIFDIPSIKTLDNTESRNEIGDSVLLQIVREYLRQISLIADEDAFTDATDSLIEYLDILVHKGANLNAQDRNFKTALILLASSQYSLKAIRYLVEAGASTLYISGGGWDAIDDATYHGNLEVARYLKGAKRQECQKRSQSQPKASTNKRWTTFWNFF